MLLFVEGGVHLFHGLDVFEIPFVVLQDDRHCLAIETVGGHVLPEIFERLDVRVFLVQLRVGYEHDAVRARKYRASGGIVLHLPGNGVKLQGEPKAANSPQIQRQEIKEQSSVRGRVEGVQLASPLRIDDAVNMLEACGLSSNCRSVVHDLDLDLAVLVVELNHEPPTKPASVVARPTLRARKTHYGPYRSADPAVIGSCGRPPRCEQRPGAERVCRSSVATLSPLWHQQSRPRRKRSSRHPFPD